MSRAGVLRHRDFRLLFVGQTVSAIGDQMFPMAVSLKVLESGGSETELGLVLTGRALALVLFLLVGGVLADRLPRTRVMVGADVGRMVTLLGLAAVPGDVPIAVLAALTFLVGAGEAFFRPAYGAVVPSVLPPEDLAAGNALTSISTRTAYLVGPAIGGLAVALGGPSTAFLVDAATFGASMASLLRIAEPPLERRPQAPFAAEVVEGVRAVRERPWIGAVLVMATLHVMLTVAPYVVLLPIVAKDRLGGTAAYTAVLVAFAFGGVPSALLAGRWRPRRPGVWSMAGLLPHAGLMLALAYSRNVWVVVAWALASGLGLEPFLVWWSSALQREVPRELLARVISLDWLMSFGLLPLGLALTGPAVKAFGRGPVLWCAALNIVVTSLAVLAVPGVAELATPRGRGAGGAELGGGAGAGGAESAGVAEPAGVPGSAGARAAEVAPGP